MYISILSAACCSLPGKSFYCLSTAFPNTVQKNLHILTKHHFTTLCFLKKELSRNIIQEGSPLHCCFYRAELCSVVALFWGKYWAYWLELLQCHICLPFILVDCLVLVCFPFLDRFHDLQMKSCNFQHILSWQAKGDPTVPTYYRVLYTDRRQVL